MNHPPTPLAPADQAAVLIETVATFLEALVARFGSVDAGADALMAYMRSAR